MDPVITSVFDLSPDEKLQLVQDLWDDIASHPKDIAVPQEVMDEVERRRDRLRSQPETATTLDEIQKRIRARHGR